MSLPFHLRFGREGCFGLPRFERVDPSGVFSDDGSLLADKGTSWLLSNRARIVNKCGDTLVIMADGNLTLTTCQARAARPKMGGREL